MKSVRVHVPQRSVSDTTDSNRSGYDVNFCDVFGGPPRRASMYEARQLYSFSDSDEFGDDEDEDETAVCYREKAVFGEDSANRRRKGNDFFNDIFGGHDSSPRKHHDPVSSSPGNSLPSPFSLPAKVMDLPTFGSHTRSYSYCRSLSQSRLSGQRQEELENAIPSFDRQRSLSRELSLDNEDSSSITKSEKPHKVGHLKNGLNGSEISSHGSQFHFSIYKWATKGVPSMMGKTDVPSSSKASNEQDNEDMPVKAGGTKAANESNKEISVQNIEAREKVQKHNALNDAVIKGLPRKSGSNVVTHKVKQFAKNINHEDSSKPKSAVDSQKFEKTTLESESITEQKKVEECLKQSDKCDSASKTDNYKCSTTFSKPNKVSVSGTDSVPDVTKTVVGDANESSKRDFLMKELPIEKIEKVQPDKELHEDMQAVDAKIHKWSNGKEANIRSLLSTLQYVLWPESGWKPVPLVDIIEGNSVKRAYQRALLRLHPDKLQQKGAASHHKYIAEKVFDILQEAWNQYNLLGSF